MSYDIDNEPLFLSGARHTPDEYAAARGKPWPKPQCLMVASDGRLTAVPIRGGFTPRRPWYSPVRLVAAVLWPLAAFIEFLAEGHRAIREAFRSAAEWIANGFFGFFDEIQDELFRRNAPEFVAGLQVQVSAFEEAYLASLRLARACGEARRHDDELWARAIGELELKLEGREPFPTPHFGEADARS